MKEFKTIFNSVQKEALVNEIKGNLFEYLVAHHLSRHFKVESQFLKRFSVILKDLLTKYESWLREHERELLTKLPLLAKAMGDEICNNINFSVSEVLVIGKITGGFHNDLYKEADLLVLGNNEELPISLKLCKKNAYVNTKSGGAKSFIAKYFDQFESSGLLQDTFNDIVDQGFQVLGQSLYEQKGLSFPGHFDGAWDGPDLPGELKGYQREVLSEFYTSLNTNLYNILLRLFEEDPQKFKQSLMSLAGQSVGGMSQAICFHNKVKANAYELDSVYYKNYDQIQEIEFRELNPAISSFSITIDNDELQIRIKPMNKFTTPSYKINCSIKYG